MEETSESRARQEKEDKDGSRGQEWQDEGFKNNFKKREEWGLGKEKLSHFQTVHLLHLRFQPTAFWSISMDVSVCLPACLCCRYPAFCSLWRGNYPQKPMSQDFWTPKRLTCWQSHCEVNVRLFCQVCKTSFWDHLCRLQFSKHIIALLGESLK